jgi:ech hydrogenase subunit D
MNMTEPQEITSIEKDELVGVAAEMFAEGYRFVQVSCATLESAYELTYSFDKEYRLKNFRITAMPDEEIPSISVIYPNAFLYENEIHDLFGLVITNIAVDYRGTLYKTTIRTPFSIGSIKARVAPKTDTGAPREKAESVKDSTVEPEKQSTS